MNTRTIAIAVALSSLIGAMQLSGCAVTRQQESVGQYVDDATITTRVKARFASDKAVDATAISIETMKGLVLLSGFAKNADEKVRAEQIARGVEGVTGVKNAIVVR
jgi:hyperosmotically inducible protein